MFNPILTTTNSKLDTRVKKPSSVVPSPSGVGSSGSTPDRFSSAENLEKGSATRKRIKSTAIRYLSQ